MLPFGKYHLTRNVTSYTTAGGIGNLHEREIDKQMLDKGLKVGYIVCLEDGRLNKKAVVLACNKWFHET